jgi:hypothetical protein
MVSLQAHQSYLMCNAPSAACASHQNTSTKHQTHIKDASHAGSIIDVLLLNGFDVSFETHQTRAHQSCLM